MTGYRKWGSAVFAIALALGVTACDEENPFEPVEAPVVTATRSGDQIDLSWTAVTGAESYTVRRSVNGAAYSDLASNHTTTAYSDTDLTVGNTYGYIVVAIGEDDSEASEPVTVVTASVLAGSITGTRTLSADTIYLIQNIVRVEDGATLNIPAGTLILGDVTKQPSALIVLQGGKIDANGTADAPIVFTSSNEPGQRNRGDWGGVAINGKGLCNFPSANDCIAEGFQAPYGGTDNADDSGTLRYVRIEFAGYEVSLGNELNALTLNAVGSGTTLEYIQTHQGLDDGFEWFGGAVDLKYAVASGISDDSYDYSTGWTGRGQFWIALQDPNDADNGFEVDNNEATEATPRTDPRIYNITLVGKGPTGGTAGESTRGLILRLGTAGAIRNAIVMGFGTAGLDIDDASTADQCTAGELIVSNSIFFENAVYLDADSDSHEDTCTAQPGWTGLLTSDPLLGDPYNWSAPDFQPGSGSPAAVAANAATPPTEFFTATNYIGAVDPAATGTLWYEGWTSFEKARGQP